MEETHDECTQYEGSNLWDCGHVEGIINCTCHVCVQRNEAVDELELA